VSHWLTCSICALRKPVGVFSAQSWGSVEGASAHAYACPECQVKHRDWREQLTRIANGSE
jgi:hypothetical protein